MQVVLHSHPLHDSWQAIRVSGYVQYIIDHNSVEEGVSDDSVVLALVDASGKCCEPNGHLWINSSKHRILVTSSPRDKTHRKWLKQTGDENAVSTMKPWSREEFVVAVYVYFT